MFSPGTELQIDDLRVQPSLRRVTRGGVALSVTGKGFDILMALAERPGQVLSKQELMDAVWPDVEVEENNLTVNISLLRRALGDLPQSPRYLVTVAGRGYTLGVPVSAVAPPVPEDMPNRASSEPHPRGPTWLRPLVLIAAVVGAALAVAAVTLWRPAARKGPPAITSLVIMPFGAEGFDTSQKTIGADLADALTVRLGERPRLSVRKVAVSSRTQSSTAAEIAREFHADAVLYGQLRRSQDTVRVFAHLDSVSDSTSLWQQQFDVPAASTFDLEDELTSRIDGNLPLPAAPSRPSGGTSDPEAFKEYMRARYWSNRYTPEGYRKALTFLRSAIEKDPAFAHAYVGLAENYYNSSNLLLEPSDAIPKARAAAEKALELDDRLSSAHVVLGMIAARYSWDWPEAEREFSHALTLDARNTDAHQARGIFFAQLGRFTEAEQELLLAQQLDPLSADLVSYAGLVQYWKGQYESAKAQARRALELDPRLYPAFVVIGWSEEAEGNLPAAIDAFQQAHDIEPNAWTSIAVAEGYARAGDKANAEARLRECQGRAGGVFVSPYDVALVYVALHRNEEAMQWLARAVKEHAEWMSYAAVDPHLDALRADPTFSALLRQLKLPEGARSHR